MREGRMRAAGLKQVEKAKADGRWGAAYQSQSKADPPSDLLAALSLNADARRMFATLDRVNRFAIIYRVNDAKRPATRSKRKRISQHVDQHVGMLARGDAIYPAKSKSSSR